MATSSVGSRISLTVRPINDVVTERLTLTLHHSGDLKTEAKGVWCRPRGAVTRGVDLKLSVDRALPVTSIFRVPGYDKTGPSKSREVKDITVIAGRYGFLEVVLKGTLTTPMLGAPRVELNVQVTDRLVNLRKQHPNFEQIEGCVDCFVTLVQQRFDLPRDDFIDISRGPAKPLCIALSTCIGSVEGAPDLGDDFANLVATLPFLDSEKLNEVSRVLEPYMKGESDAVTAARSELQQLISISEVEPITDEMTALNLKERVVSFFKSATSSASEFFRGED